MGLQIEMTKTKDFTRPEYANPVIDMWEFFNENPQYKLIKYEPVKGGIRVFYELVSYT